MMRLRRRRSEGAACEMPSLEPPDESAASAVILVIRVSCQRFGNHDETGFFLNGCFCFLTTDLPFPLPSVLNQFPSPCRVEDIFS